MVLSDITLQRDRLKTSLLDCEQMIFEKALKICLNQDEAVEPADLLKTLRNEFKLTEQTEEGMQSLKQSENFQVFI